MGLSQNRFGVVQDLLGHCFCTQFCVFFKEQSLTYDRENKDFLSNLDLDMVNFQLFRGSKKSLSGLFPRSSGVVYEVLEHCF